MKEMMMTRKKTFVLDDCPAKPLKMPSMSLAAIHNEVHAELTVQEQLLLARVFGKLQQRGIEITVVIP